MAQVPLGDQGSVYPEEAIQSYLAFLARRRAQRPTGEYRVPSEEEWQEFLGHFERRKVATGICGRAFSTPCIHEHACDAACTGRTPAQRHRITEAEREGWHGEVEGQKVSLAGADAKLAQLDQIARRAAATFLGMPAFADIAGRTALTSVTPSQDSTCNIQLLLTAIRRASGKIS